MNHLVEFITSLVHWSRGGYELTPRERFIPVNYQHRRSAVPLGALRLRIMAASLRTPPQGKAEARQALRYLLEERVHTGGDSRPSAKATTRLVADDMVAVKTEPGVQFCERCAWYQRCLACKDEDDDLESLLLRHRHADQFADPVRGLQLLDLHGEVPMVWQRIIWSQAFFAPHVAIRVSDRCGQWLRFELRRLLPESIEQGPVDFRVDGAWRNLGTAYGPVLDNCPLSAVVNPSSTCRSGAGIIWDGGLHFGESSHGGKRGISYTDSGNGLGMWTFSTSAFDIVELQKFAWIALGINVTVGAVLRGGTGGRYCTTCEAQAQGGVDGRDGLCSLVQTTAFFVPVVHAPKFLLLI